MSAGHHKLFCQILELVDIPPGLRRPYQSRQSWERISEVGIKPI
jgi:hypothetical protein